MITDQPTVQPTEMTGHREVTLPTILSNNNDHMQVKTEFMNKSMGRQDVYSDNEDIAVMMFDINYGYKRYYTELRNYCFFSP